MLIRNKKQMAHMLESGALGPAFPICRCGQRVPSGCSSYGIRVQRLANEKAPCYPNLSYGALFRKAHQLLEEGIPRERLLLYAMPSTHGQLINAELAAIDGIPTMYYSLDAELPMRPALAKSGQHKRGHRVWMLLGQLLPQETVCMLREMFDCWGDAHTIEFTGYDHAVTDGGCHAVIWEVRAY